MDRPEFLDFEEVIARSLGSIAGLEAVDIGAGSGRVTRRLAALGADVVGVEPNAEQVAKAEAEGGGARYLVATAEATGLDEGAFDLALFSLSLHHIPDMPAAIREARRLARAGGRIAVIEPIAPDPIYPTMRFIDDESAVYAEAQAALAAAVSAGALRHERTLRFAAKYRVETPDEMVADLVTVDSGRRLAEADRAPFEAAFAAAQERDEEGGFIPYWSRMDVYARL